MYEKFSKMVILHVFCSNIQLSVIGTPAEESGGGKIELINAGVFDDVDVAMMAHPAPFTDARPIFLGGKR